VDKLKLKTRGKHCLWLCWWDMQVEAVIVVSVSQKSFHHGRYSSG